MDKRPVPTMEFASRVTSIIYGVVGTFMEKTSFGLEESRHAPKTHLSDKENTKTFPVADVDDTVSFMAAARSLKLPKTYGTPTVAVDASSEKASTSMSRPESRADAEVFASSGQNTYDDEWSIKPDAEESEVKPETPKAGVSSVFGDSKPQGYNAAATISAGPRGSEAVASGDASEVEDRENLTTFKSWGTPAARDKPASRVRRIILRGLPATWCTPAKVLSLVHGGNIESVHVHGNGTAHILFCEHEACQTFYDKYPNGIDLDKERRITVFVEMGKEVDVVSSQLSFNLSVGSTRAVRAVGVDMNASMAQLYSMACGSDRKVEKILDSYVPGDARNVVFRFCSIEDAVRFRGILVRDPEWEHCNVQYATDP
ncbi:similar to An02g14160 [Aspergillus luchuensis]|uniref:Similar to An02g14160 n=1 Tax=Aspergillus kawachii TaxID=1069201 RepID=A0A146FDZ5_ASPKA|nr:similar to An02g14160 [Aspergillus luchuensis]